MPPTEINLLELNEIKKTYAQGGIWAPKQASRVLDGVNMKIAPGSCLGLLGRSGSGKSTLGRIALGLEVPDAGTVRYKGKDIRMLTREEYRQFRRNVQVVFQNALGSVNGRFRAFDIVAEPLVNFARLTKAELSEKVEDLLQQVGLDPTDGKKYPHQFSGGELQRICIARAIALQPELIVLDEAVSSLDMLIQTKIVTLLQELQERMGIAFLFISHDIRVVLRMTERLAIIQAGRIVEETEDISGVDQFSHPAFGGLLEAILPPVPA